MAAESKLQIRIRKDLEKDGWYVVKISICNKPGYPDLQAMKSRRRLVYFEIKSPGKKAEPLQEYVHDILRKIGFSVFVVDEWDKYLFIKERI